MGVLLLHPVGMVNLVVKHGKGGNDMAMVLNPREDVTVEVAEGDEIDASIAHALEELGLSYEELRSQAEDDEFASEDARRLWFMISPLGA